jgi:hypothetical protein
MNDQEQHTCGTERFCESRFWNEEEQVMENLF